MMKWPFVSADATLAQAIAFVAQGTQSEDETVRDSARRVRDHVRKAAGRRRKPVYTKPRDPSKAVGEKFWIWARDEWPVLNSMPGFPYARENSGSGRGVLPELRGFGYGYQFPSDPDMLKQAFHEAHSTISRLHMENIKLHEENDGLKARLSCVETKLNGYQQREASIRKKRSDAGKRGRGIRRT
jgi:hypothetical protein